MTELVEEAMGCGAIGFATSRLEFHRRGDKELLPTFEADESELKALAASVAGKGVMQLVTNVSFRDNLEARRNEIALLGRISAEAGVRITFTLSQSNSQPELLEMILGWVDAENAKPGVDVRPQFAPRPIGAHVGFALSTTPFDACPTYRGLRDLPLDERIVELRKPEIRAKIVREAPEVDVLPIVLAARQFGNTFPVTDPPTYEPDPATSVAAIAERSGLTPEEVAYDHLLEGDGHGMLYVAMSNYGSGNLDHIRGMFDRQDSLVGLGDGGAHYGIICDASYPTFVLTHWTKQRSGSKIGLAQAVKSMTSVSADVFGLGDRGRLAVGLKADINVIDYDRLRLDAPTVVADLPGAGRRMHQTARGYRRTIVSGTTIVLDDEPTGELPGRVVRGQGTVQ
jgi:N-acyl-D-aspartate/D-glutamate deacylase